MKTRNAALASAAAALFVAGIGGGDSVAAHHEESEKIKCEGVNSCKGESACKTLFSDCAGHNDCKGKGFVMLSPDECEQAKAGMDAETDEG